MNIIPVGAIGSMPERTMQDQLIKILSERTHYRGFDEQFPYCVFEEVHIPEIGRRSDIVIYITDRIIINIECKLDNYTEVLSQAKDHATWADYSYICIHHSAFIPTSVIREMIENRIGLIYWVSDNQFIEVINGMKIKNDNKNARSSVLRTLKKKQHMKTAITENNQLSF